MILEADGGGRLLCEKQEDGTLRLCRAFGSVDRFVLPETVHGFAVTSIGAYCFSGKARLSEELRREAIEAGLGDGSGAPDGMLRPISGDYLREAVLPDSVRTLETYAFYNCRRLERLDVGAGLTEVHSDAFMNCGALHTLAIRAGAGDKTGLPVLLNRLASELCVEFSGFGAETVRLIYPEYTESYELIGPAHIFGLHVEGEGYRARKQFIDGRLDAPGYDAVFAKACNEEQFLTLMKMAICRIEYPYGLSDDARKRYQEYIARNETAVLEQLAAAQDEESLCRLCKEPMVSDEAVRAAIERAVADGWTRGVAAAISARNSARGRQTPA